MFFSTSSRVERALQGALEGLIHLADNRYDGLLGFAVVDRITSRNRFDKAQPKGAVAGDSRPVPTDPDMVGIEHPAVFP